MRKLLFIVLSFFISLQIYALNFQSDAPKYAEELDMYSYTPIITDNVGETKMWCENLPEWLHFDGTTLFGIPYEKDIIENESPLISIFCADSQDTVSQQFNILINYVTFLPEITKPLSKKNIHSEKIYFDSILVSARYPEQVKLKITQVPSWLSIRDSLCSHELKLFFKSVQTPNIGKYPVELYFEYGSTSIEYVDTLFVDIAQSIEIENSDVAITISNERIIVHKETKNIRIIDNKGNVLDSSNTSIIPSPKFQGVFYIQIMLSNNTIINKKILIK
ncbi:MAG: hypothetical protein IKO90_10990 [Bacteroidales bacterium]|nr:hypothetical protein [Bacteroidales bacterium]